MKDRFYGGPLGGKISETMEELPEQQQITHPTTGAMYVRTPVLDDPEHRAWNYMDIAQRLDMGYGLNPNGDTTVRMVPRVPNTRLTLDEIIDWVDACRHARVPGDTIPNVSMDFSGRLKWLEANPTRIEQPRK